MTIGKRRICGNRILLVLLLGVGGARAWMRIHMPKCPQQPAALSNRQYVLPTNVVSSSLIPAASRSEDDPYTWSSRGQVEELDELAEKYIKLIKDLCPAVSKGLLYINSRVRKDMQALEGLSPWQDPIESRTWYKDAIAYLDGRAGLIPFPMGPSGSMTSPEGELLIPLVHNKITLGWLLLQQSNREKGFAWPTKGPEITRLNDVVGCLETALQVAEDRWLEHEKTLIEHAQLALSVREFRSPLGALRTFGKLLIRRLERDPEQLNLELARNVLIQSDRLADLVGSVGEVTGCLSPQQLEEYHRPLFDHPVEVREDEGGRALSLCELGELLAPVVAAAQAISARDGINFNYYLQEGLPRLLLDRFLLTEAIGAIVELALSYTLEGPSTEPSVSLEVMMTQQESAAEGEVVVVVRDNGRGVLLDTPCPTTQTTTALSCKTRIGTGDTGLPMARKLVERLGCRLDVGRCPKMGGTMCTISLGFIN